VKRIVACVVLVSLLGCTSTTEPEPIMTPEQAAVLAQADSIMAVMDRRIMFMTAPGAGGTSDPECQKALREYAAATTAYLWALNLLRTAPSTANAMAAIVAAMFYTNASLNVVQACEQPRVA
jgi:hypothetical protein